MRPTDTLPQLTGRIFYSYESRNKRVGKYTPTRNIIRVFGAAIYYAASVRDFVCVNLALCDDQFSIQFGTLRFIITE